MSPTLPRVVAYRSLAELEPWRESLDALNAASRRPSPFHAIEYLELVLSSDEFAPPDAVPLLLVAMDGERPVGFLALRRRSERGFGRRRRIEFLVTHDTERPALVARAADEARCAEAFLQHLDRVERRWSCLELMEQDAESPFLTLRGLDARRYHVRQYRNNPNATVHVPDASYEAWLQPLIASKGALHDLARRVRLLLARGRVEFVACEVRDSPEAMLGLYLDLEARSWKADAHAGISRHPRRVELFRRMLQLRSCAPACFHFVLVDDVPIAGMLSIRFADTAYQMETVFDDAFAPLAPGNLLFVLALRDALEQGVRSYNLLTNFAYHKARLGATITETAALQIYRLGSRHHLRARLGELRRRWFGATLQQNEATHNLSKPAERTPRDAGTSRADAARMLAEVERAGGVRRLTGEQIVAALRFQGAGGERGARRGNPSTQRAP